MALSGLVIAQQGLISGGLLTAAQGLLDADDESEFKIVASFLYAQDVPTSVCYDRATLVRKTP